MNRTLALSAGTAAASPISHLPNAKPSSLMLRSSVGLSLAGSHHTITSTRTTRMNRGQVALKPTASSSSASASPTSVESSPSSSSSTATMGGGGEAEGTAESEGKIGARVRVKVPLKVYHVTRVPEVDLTGMEGVIKQYVGLWKGKRISANLPYKVEFVADLEGRGSVKFFAHLKEEEFEYLD